MKKDRLEAFSDGVIAILITIMVLELKVPRGDSFGDLKPLIPVFLSYILSFIYLGIYWNNHHHLLHTVVNVTGNILWANLHLLFWLSLIPFVTGWIGVNHFAPIPMSAYGFVLLMAAIAYHILQNQILQQQNKDSKLVKVFERDIKGKLSPVLYFIAIVSAFINEWISGALYVIVAFMWLIPDKRIEDSTPKKSTN